MKRGKRLVGNTIIIAIGNLSTKVISFLLLPLYTSILTTSEYGTYDLLITLAAFLIPVITLLMEESMFRFLIDCENEEEKKVVITQTCLYCIVSIIIFSLLIFLVSLFINIPYKYLFILYLISSVMTALKNALTRGLGKIKLFSLTNFLSSLIIIILNIIFIAKLRIGVSGLLLSSILGHAIISLLVFIILKIWKYVSINKLNVTKMKEMIKYSLPLVPNSISWGIINLSDRLVVTTFLGTSANGVYSVSYKFPTIIDTIYGFFYTAWKEEAAKTLKDSDSSLFYNKVYSVLKNFMWSITIGLLSILPFIFNLLVNSSFDQAYLYIPVLLVAIYYSNIAGYYGGIFTAYKDTKVMGITTIIGALINLFVDLLLIKYIGIWAAAVSTLMSTMFVYIFRRVKLRKYVNLNENKIYFILSWISLIVTLFSYYSKNLILQILALMVIIGYCIFLNRMIISIFYKKFKKIINKG